MRDVSDTAKTVKAAAEGKLDSHRHRRLHLNSSWVSQPRDRGTPEGWEFVAGSRPIVRFVPCCFCTDDRPTKKGKRMSIFSKIIEGIKAIGRGVGFGFKQCISFVEWLERSLLGSGGSGGVPAYTPSSSRTDMANVLHEARAAAAVPTIDPSGLALTKRYCTAKKTERETMDLSVLPAEARLMLLTMDDNELAALGNAGPGQIRKFLVGKDHGLHGVPVVGIHVPPAPAERPSVARRIAWQAEEREMKPLHSAGFAFPR